MVDFNAFCGVIFIKISLKNEYLREREREREKERERERERKRERERERTYQSHFH